MHRLLAHLQQVARPRHAQWDPLGLMGVRTYIHEQLSALGPVEEHHFSEAGEAGTNLILRLPGRNSALAPLLVGAHYDGPQHSIGADDNASGVAARTAGVDRGLRQGGVGNARQPRLGPGAAQCQTIAAPDGEPGDACLHRR